MSSIIQIYFDGSCTPYPKRKYGSYLVKVDGEWILKQERIDFGKGTNHEAEFDILILALGSTINFLKSERLDPDNYAVQIRTDSRLLRYRMMETNHCGRQEWSKRMFRYTNEALALANQFMAFDVTWEPREANVLHQLAVNLAPSNSPIGPWLLGTAPSFPR